MNPIQYQGPLYIKQLEEAILPNREPYTNIGFPHGGTEIKLEYKQPSRDLVPLYVAPDFLPFPKDFNRYIYNKKNGYIERDVRYPIYKTGFVG